MSSLTVYASPLRSPASMRNALPTDGQPLPDILNLLPKFKCSRPLAMRHIRRAGPDFVSGDGP